MLAGYKGSHLSSLLIRAYTSIEKRKLGFSSPDRTASSCSSNKHAQQRTYRSSFVQNYFFNKKSGLKKIFYKKLDSTNDKNVN